jgi:hypothetical protein
MSVSGQSSVRIRTLRIDHETIGPPETPCFRAFVDLARLLLSNSRADTKPALKERSRPMRNVVTTLIFAGASLLGAAGIVGYADPAVATTPVIALHGSPPEPSRTTEAYARIQVSLDQQAARPVQIATR